MLENRILQVNDTCSVFQMFSPGKSSVHVFIIALG